jgi:hypothetical protein
MGDARAQAIDDTPAGGTDSQRPLDYGDTVVLESNNNGNRVAAPTGTNSVIYFKETRATGGVAMQNIVTGAEPVLADGKSDATIQKTPERLDNNPNHGSECSTIDQEIGDQEISDNDNRGAASAGSGVVACIEEALATEGVAMQHIVTGEEPVLADGKSDATIVQKATERAENSVEGGSVSESPSKKCYWKIAEEELKEKNPNAYNDLQNLQAFNKRAAFPVGNSDSPVAHDGEAILMKSRSIADETLEVATELWDKVEGKKWKVPFKFRGKEFYFRDAFRSVVKALKMFKDVGSTIAAMDRIHAGIPWAAVNVVLEVSVPKSLSTGNIITRMVRSF